MNIDKALSHFEFKLTEDDGNGKKRLKKSFKPTGNDIKAFNAIVQYKKKQESKSLYDNESLAKLFLESFMIKMDCNMYTSETALEAISTTLEYTVYELCMKLKEKIPLYKFNNIGEKKYPSIQNKELVEKYGKELTEALTTEVTEDQVIRWVGSKVNKILQIEKG